MTGLGYQNGQRHRHSSVTFENRHEFSGVFLAGRVGPQGHTQTHKIVAV